MRSVLTLLIAFGLLHAEGVLEVEWPKPNKQRQKSMKAYPKALKNKIKDVKLPVYLPRYYIYKKEMLIVSDKLFYTATIPLQGATLMITGDRTYQQKVKSDNKQLKANLKAVDTKFVHTEGMMSTSFNRHGINYSLVLECDSPNKDKRCREDKFLKKIYNGLIVVGGRP
jgi:hypothetical protein